MLRHEGDGERDGSPIGFPKDLAASQLLVSRRVVTYCSLSPSSQRSWIRARAKGTRRSRGEVGACFLAQKNDRFLLFLSERVAGFEFLFLGMNIVYLEFTTFCHFYKRQRKAIQRLYCTMTGEKYPIRLYQKQQ
jgi:hypothetical protein